MNWKKWPFVQQIHSRPRLFFALILGVGLYLVLPSLLLVGDTTRFLLSWNAAVGLYLLLAGFMMAQSSPEKIRRRALHQDDGRTSLAHCVLSFFFNAAVLAFTINIAASLL